jgi:hypothetical protein
LRAVGFVDDFGFVVGYAGHCSSFLVKELPRSRTLARRGTTSVSPATVAGGLPSSLCLLLAARPYSGSIPLCVLMG